MARTRSSFPEDAENRVIIEAVEPEVDAGRYPAKATPGEVRVECDAFADGHDALEVTLLYRRAGRKRWETAPMEHVVNDRWRGAFEADGIGRWEYTIRGRVDHWATWAEGMRKWVAANVDVETHFAVGRELLEATAERAESGSGASGRSSKADAR